MVCARANNNYRKENAETGCLRLNVFPLRLNLLCSYFRYFNQNQAQIFARDNDHDLRKGILKKISVHVPHKLLINQLEVAGQLTKARIMDEQIYAIVNCRDHTQLCLMFNPTRSLVSIPRIVYAIEMILIFKRLVIQEFAYCIASISKKSVSLFFTLSRKSQNHSKKLGVFIDWERVDRFIPYYSTLYIRTATCNVWQFVSRQTQPAKINIRHWHCLLYQFLHLVNKLDNDVDVSSKAERIPSRFKRPMSKVFMVY